MKSLCYTFLLLVFVSPILNAQVLGSSGEEEGNLFSELLEAVGPDDELFTGSWNMRELFRKNYAGKMGTCDDESCIVVDYFLAISVFYFAQGYRGKTQLEVFEYYAKFWKEELEFLEAQGFDLRKKVETPMKYGKLALWFELWEASSTGYAMGGFDLTMLGCAQALLDHGIGLDEKTGTKGSLGSDFKGFLAERLLGVAADEIMDVNPTIPETAALKKLFSTPELLNFTWKGEAYHMILKNRDLIDMFYLLVQLEELGYDLTKGDCAKCKGMNGLMVYAFSGAYGFGSQGEYVEEEMMAHLKHHKESFDLQDGKGNTALHYAAENLATWYIIALSELGADLNLKNKKGQTPLAVLYAKKESSKPQSSGTRPLGDNGQEDEELNEMIELLESKGAKKD